MAATFIGQASGTVVAQTSLTATVHASTQAGDFLVLHLGVWPDGVSQPALLAGWTQWSAPDDGSWRNLIAYRVRQSGDTSYVWSIPNGVNGRVRWQLSTWRGDSELAATAATGTLGSSSITVPAGMLVSGATAEGTTLNVPTGYTAISAAINEEDKVIRGAYRTVTAGVVTNQWTGDTPTNAWAMVLAEALQPPVANFSISSAQVFDNQTVSFTDTSASTVATWVWERKLSSGNTWTQFSTSQNPSSVAFTAGTWDVRLTATNAAGTDSETKTGVLVVLPAALQASTLASQGLIYHASSEANAAISITIPSGVTTSAFTYSFTGSPTNATLTIQEVQEDTSYPVGAPITHAANETFDQLPFVLVAKPGLDLKVTLSAGGLNVIGRLTVQTRALGG